MADIINNTARSQFEMQTEWGPALLTYHETTDAISLDHTETPEGAQGKGVAGRFVIGVLDQLRAEGRKIIPRCSFVQHVLRKHPDYADMILA